MQAPGGGHEAAAIGDDHHWHLREGLGGARIPVDAGEMVGRFRHEALERPLETSDRRYRHLLPITRLPFSSGAVSELPL